MNKNNLISNTFLYRLIIYPQEANQLKEGLLLLPIFSGENAIGETFLS